jgi:hypothetical protein
MQITSYEKQKIADLRELQDHQSNLEELELHFKEKWYAAKDFVDGNDSLKMRDFEKWIKNTYNPQKKSFRIKIKNLKLRYGIK